MPGRVAGQLAGIECAGRLHELVHRPLRIEAEHDRSVAELQIEVDQQDSLVGLLGRGRRRGWSRAPSCRCRPSARRRSRRGRAAPRIGQARSTPPRLPVSWALRIANEIVSGQLRQDEHVVDPRVKAVSTRSGCASGTSSTIGACVWRRITATSASSMAADGSPSRPAPSRTAWTPSEPRYGTASRTLGVQAITSSPLPEASSASCRSDSPSNVPRYDDAERLRAAARGEGRHLLPPASTVENVSVDRPLSFGFLTGRSCSVQSPFFIT